MKDNSYREYVAAKHLSKRIFQITPYFFKRGEEKGYKELLKIIILVLELLYVRDPLFESKYICTKATGRHFSEVN